MSESQKIGYMVKILISLVKVQIENEWDFKRHVITLKIHMSITSNLNHQTQF